MSPVRLSVVMTHPIQYYAPWFKYIAETVPAMTMRVHYCVIPTPEQQGVGFEAPFTWDASLLDGYDYTILREPSRKVTLHSSAFMGVAVPEIAKSVHDFNPDVVLVPGWHSISLVIAAASARISGLPVIYRGDSQLWTPDGFPAVLKRWRTSAMLGLFTHFLAVGQRNHSYLRSYFVPESRIFVSPHCVDNKFFSDIATSVDRSSQRRKLGIDPDSFVILFAGKLEKKKRPWEAIEAAGLMTPPATVIVAGSGEAEARCRAAAKSSAARTIFLGFMNQSEIAELYGLADCLVLPSDSGETWGLVVNEALAAGLPAVVSDQVGCGPDLIEDGVTGYMTPFADPVHLAQTLSRLRTDLEQGHRFGPACRARADKYSFRAATGGLRDAVDAATSGSLTKSTKLAWSSRQSNLPSVG